MKILIISDIHIGDPRLSNESKIISLLSNNKFDKIILLGDIVDCWLGGQKLIKNNKIIRTLNKISKSTDIVWVRGNHDSDLDMKSFINCVTLNVYDFIDNNIRFRALHGHQAYVDGNSAWYHKLYVNIDSWLYLVTNGLINLSGAADSVFNKYRSSIARGRLMKGFCDGADIIIIGHTHIQCHQSNGKVDLYDNGSTMLGDYTVIDNGMVYLKKL